MRKTIAVTSDDPVRPKITLQVGMTILGSVRILPVNRVALRFQPDRPAEGRLLVRQDPTETGELKLDGMKVSEGWLKVSARKLEEPTKVDDRLNGLPGDWLLEFRVPERPEAALSRATVRFQTGLNREPEITIPVSVTARRIGVPSTRRVLLSRNKETGIVSGKLVFKTRRGVDPAKVAVTVDPDAYLVETRTQRPNQLEVTVRSKGPLPEAAAGGDGPVTLRFRFGRESVTVPARRVN